MSDFHQNLVPTFPLFAADNLAELRQAVVGASRQTPIGLIIPALYQDLASDAMRGIIRELASMEFIRRVYVSLDKSQATDYQQARSIVAPLENKAVLLWNDAPAVRAVVTDVESVLPVGPRGKGQAVWLALGYALGKREVSVIAFHDADIVTYKVEFLLRLLYPVVHLRYQFSKGYYVRYSSQLHGRVTRLFYFPLVRALRDMLPKNDFLDYMADFRYPLAGEFATFATIANELLFPSDWGIEVGILAEMFRLTRPHRICQVEITERYDHKHQDAGADAGSGLTKMASDIARTFFSRLSAGGTVLSPEFLRSLKHTYLVNARSSVRTYSAMAEMNALSPLDLHSELALIEKFAAALDSAFAQYSDLLFGSPQIPDWRRIESALPGTLDRLVKAFEQ